jgi:hypothetical protein
MLSLCGYFVELCVGKFIDVLRVCALGVLGLLFRVTMERTVPSGYSRGS